MNHALGIAGFLLTVLLGYGLLCFRQERIKRREARNIDIPVFLRSEGAGDHPVNGREVNTTRICRIARAE